MRKNFVAVNKDHNLVSGFGEEVRILDHGWGFEFVDTKTCYATADFEYFDISGIDLPADIPTMIKDYCYTPEEGFYVNPDPPKEMPYGVDPAIVEQIQADYREKLAKEVSENGYNA